MIVLDASALIEILLNTASGSKLLNRIAAEGHSLHAPHLIDLEVVQVLRRYVLSRELTGERAGEALLDLGDVQVAKYPHEPFLSRIWELRAHMTAYDGVYVALAEELGAPLVTGDRRLARAPGHSAAIEII